MSTPRCQREFEHIDPKLRTSQEKKNPDKYPKKTGLAFKQLQYLAQNALRRG